MADRAEPVPRSCASDSSRRSNEEAEISFRSKMFMYEWLADGSEYAAMETFRLLSVHLEPSERRCMAAAIKGQKFQVVYFNKEK